MIAGLNIKVSVQRVTEGDDDVVGGATATVSTVYRDVRARISAVKPSEDGRIQGLESSKLFNCVIWPATLTILESDYIVPDNGPHADKSFRVTGVQIDSLGSNVRRAHINLRLLHEDRARSLQ